MTIQDCKFVNNQVLNGLGGAIYVYSLSDANVHINDLL